MSGYGDILDEDKGIIGNTYLLTPGKTFEQAENPLNRYSTISNGTYARISPAYGFAKALIGKSTHPVGLLVNARNGSSIDMWKKGNDEYKLYQHTLERALEAQKWGTIKAIIWHQGESDAWQPAAYSNLLKTLVNNFRTDLGDNTASPSIFFVAGEIAYWRTSGTSAAFNSMIQTISTFLPNSGWVSADGLTQYINDDDPHFSREGAITLGERYAEKVIAKFYNSVGTKENGMDVQNKSIQYTLNGMNIIIHNLTESDSEIFIYDIYGRNMYNTKFTDQISFTFPTKGIYILTNFNEKYNISQKICVD